jgi:hypothetical protein
LYLLLSLSDLVEVVEWGEPGRIFFEICDIFVSDAGTKPMLICGEGPKFTIRVMG